jgi:hypothetical protein
VEDCVVGVEVLASEEAEVEYDLRLDSSLQGWMSSA